MKRNFTFLIAAVALLASLAFPMQGWAQTKTETTTTYTFSSKSWAASPANWTSGKDGNSYQANQGVQVTTGTTGANATSPISFENVSKIVVTYCTNASSGGGTIKMKVGNGSEQSFSVTKPSSGGTTLKTTTFNYDTHETGNVKITVNCTANSVYIYSVAITTISGDTPNTYSVTYDANGATSGSVPEDNNEYESGAEVTVLGNTGNLAKAFYSFNGWNTSADGSGSAYSAGDTFEIEANTTLYAQWSPIANLNIATYTITSTSAVTGSGTIPTGSSASYSSTYNTNYQLTNGNSMTLTLSGYDNQIVKGLVLSMRSNASGGAGYMSAVAGTTTIASIGSSSQGVAFNNEQWNGSYTTNYVDVNISMSDDTYVIQQGEDLVIVIGATANSLYCQSYTVYYETSTEPSLSAENVDLDYDDISGEISYSVANVEGGSMVATTGADWITDFTYGESSVGFTTSANPSRMERTATVTLTYTYNREILTANVSVTQAGNPDVPMTIAEAREQGTGSVLTQGIVTSCVGTTGYIQDATAAICVYGVELTVGDEIRVSGVLSTYHNLLEIGSSDSTPTVTVISSNNTVNPELMTIAQINASTNQGWLIRIEEATIEAIGSNNNYTVAQGENTITVHGDLGEGEVNVGDLISLTGNIGCYNTVQIVNLSDVTIQENTTPIINAQGIEIAYDATQGVINYSVTHAVEGISLNASTNADWISDFVITDETVTFTTSVNVGNTDRTAAITLSYEGAEDKVVNVSQQHLVVDYAILPFNWEGGAKDVLLAMPGVTSKGLGSGYGSTHNPYNIQFDTEGDYIQVKTNSQPGVVTIGVKMIGGNGTSKIIVKGSADGQTFDDGEELTISGSQNAIVNLTSTRSFGSDVRYVRLYFNKGSNVGVGPIAIYKGSLDITGYGEGNGNWYLIASPYPVAPAEVTNFITSTNSGFDLYRFDESVDKEWVNYKGDPTTNNDGGFNLVPGQGYLYARNNDVQISFSGTEYSGNGTFDLSFTSEAEFEGWNLVGNPYRINALVDKDYYLMNEDGELIPTDHANAVAPMQGLFVQATQTGQSVTFTKVFPPATNSKEAAVTLNLSRNRGDVIDRAIVRFGEGSQLHKFQLRENSTKVYFTEGNQDFAVVRSQEAQGEMPVNFKAEENGTYTLSVNAEEMELNYLHLIDNMTGMDVDLLQTPSYTFDATTNDYTSRFRLVFSASQVPEPVEGPSTFAFFNGTEWQVSNTGEATLQVIDVNGRIVSNETINGTVATSINATPGVYMLRLVNGNEVKTQKIVVR